MSVNQCSTAMGDDDVSSGSINITDCLNQILDFSEAQLTCSICSDLMDNPVAVACGHIFCSICIEDWFQTKENCPSCREACPGGEHSEGVVAIGEYLRYLKPLIISRDKEQYRSVRRSLSAVIAPTERMEEQPGAEASIKFEKKRAATMENFMRERLLSIKTESEYCSLEVALILVKCALAKQDVDQEEFLTDIQKFSKFPQMVIEKYMSHPIMTDIDHQYAPKIRKKKFVLEWPTSRSWIQILTVLFLGVVSYFTLEGLEEEGFNLLSESLLRAISLLNVYIDLVRYFQ